MKFHESNSTNARNSNEFKLQLLTLNYFEAVMQQLPRHYCRRNVTGVSVGFTREFSREFRVSEPELLLDIGESINVIPIGAAIGLSYWRPHARYMGVPAPASL